MSKSKRDKKKQGYLFRFFISEVNVKLLEERILKDGNILGENILKVDSFLTHQVDYS